MFWDKVAFVYDLFVKVYNRRAHKRLCEEVERLIDKDDVILECACGTGMLSERVAPLCKSLTATDLSEGMLRQARKKCSRFDNVEFVLADINDLKYSDESFDKVIAANVIHLLDEPLKAIRELERVCKRKGLLIIPTYMNRSEYGDDSVFSNVADKAGADFKRQFTFDSYRRFFEEAGFKNGRYVYIEGMVPCAIAILEKK